MFLRNRAEQGLQIALPNGLAGEGYGLVQQAEGVPHAPFTGPRQRGETPVLDADALLGRDVAEALDDLGPRDPTKAIVLAARQNGRRDLVDLGGGEDEDHVGRRFLERLQQRVER